MSDIAIRVNELSKRYSIGAPQAAYRTIRESLVDGLQAPFRRTGRLLRGQAHGAADLQESIWALKDVSFEINRGEVVGIIGRNGAGKSTLLKLLSKITRPSRGRAEIHGRVGSLLEVGTGFHPELTGRENVYLNGTIMGMRKREIDRKFDEIVAFAEIEKFLDTPVKHYSSGMYVRLAFAVAAHLEPEILLVDEVLAVGDAAFQKKCLGKMSEVTRLGRTVLFVSHNMIAVQDLCQRAIWLDEGTIRYRGEAGETVSRYLQWSATDSISPQKHWPDMRTAPGNDRVRLKRISVSPENGGHNQSISRTTPFLIDVEYWNLIPDIYLHVTLHIFTEQGVVAFTTGSLNEPKWKGGPFETGLYRSVCHVPGNLLNNGVYMLRILFIENQARSIYKKDDVISFNVLETPGTTGAWYGKEPGIVRPELDWITERLKPLLSSETSESNAAMARTASTLQ